MWLVGRIHCENTFLKLWSWPNPVNEKGVEFCDLLVVFENEIFIFFDRESKTLEKSDKDLQILWNRWSKETITKQSKTALGAERYIKLGRPIFLDDKKTKPLPVSIDPQIANIHKIIVAHGAEERCLTESKENIYGSLAISYFSEIPVPKETPPFHVFLDPKDKIHVLDSFSIKVVFSEFDTISEFSSYYNAKEKLMEDLKALVYIGEEDLVGHYLSNVDISTRKHTFLINESEYNGFFVEEGFWNSFSQTHAYLRKKQADSQSYLWDNLIQITSENILNQTAVVNTDTSFDESALHIMAREPRHFRRALVEVIEGANRTFPDNPKGTFRHFRVVQSSQKDTAYVYLQLHQPELKDNKKRRKMLEILLGCTKNKKPHLKRIVGIALAPPKLGVHEGEDILLLKCDKWSTEDTQYYEENNHFNFYKTNNMTIQKGTFQEYPSSANLELKKAKVGRNDPCPCGSGIKYKKCCHKLVNHLKR